MMWKEREREKESEMAKGSTIQKGVKKDRTRF